VNALVLGLARSGQAAALALARRGERVVAADRSAELDAGRLEGAGVEVHLGSEETSLLDGI
jgi:UDP-N-acetylmuramoylalanine-D-glutamate ligase